MFALSRIVEHGGQVDRGGEDVPEVIVGVEDHLVPVDVVPGHVTVVVHLGHTNPGAGRADVVLTIPDK